VVPVFDFVQLKGSEVVLCFDNRLTSNETLFIYNQYMKPIDENK